MKIQIHSSISNMSTTGRQVLGDMQDSYTPLVDLLVRESIQNSTDAAKQINGADSCVLVSFDHKKILNGGINNLFEGIEDKLAARFPSQEESDCLVIRDSGTYGLTGALRKVDVPIGESLGNLIKLVYDIRKPQENPGAGGAWGLGKTVYYRLGLGIVLYYSRINVEGDKFESRLAACLVEDETKSDSLLPECPLDDRKSGIAWWGQYDGENKTIPINDPTEIKRVLDLFGVEEYKGNETGTTIIIPYLNENKLMDITRYRNHDSDDGDNNISNYRPWLKKLIMFIRVSVQRWYYPRLDNKYYSVVNNLRYLKVKLNGRELSNDLMDPLFQLMQSLYNRSALKTLPGDYSDFITMQSVQEEDYYYGNSSQNCKYGMSDIKINKYIDRNGCVGAVAYARADENILRMLPPDLCPDPYKYFDIDPNLDEDVAVVAYTRKPGMVVWYELIKNKSLHLDGKNFILGHFALNSLANVSNKGALISLEDYIRSTEVANHKSWNEDDLRITHNLKNNVKNKLIQAFEQKEKLDNIDGDTGLGTILGGILPPRGFGNKSSKDKIKGGTNGGATLIGKKSKLKVFQEGNPKYSNNNITLCYMIEIPGNFSSMFALELAIASESGSIVMEKLLNSIQIKKSPVEIVEVKMSSPELCILDLDTNMYCGKDVKLTLQEIDGVPYRIEIVPNNIDKLIMSLEVTLQYTSSDMKPQIIIN